MSSGLELKPPSAPPEIDESDEESAIEAMVEWFRENFEDPAMETPYESAEGGYQWIWGGPYDASEELSDAFSEVSEDLIARAVEEIQSDGLFDWAPAGIRIQPDDEPDQEDEQSLETRLDSLAGQLDRIETYIAYWRDRAPLLGHNRPPDEFRLEPDDPDLQAAEISVAEVRAELVKPSRADTADAAVITRAEGNFRRLSKKIWGWILAGGAALTLGVIGGVGKEVGQDLAKDPHAFWEVLEEASTTLSHWAAHLTSVS